MRVYVGAGVLVAITMLLMRPYWAGVIDSQTGKGFPEAAAVTPGQTVATPASVGEITKGWFVCGALDVSCDDVPVMRGPLVFRMSKIKPRNGCFTNHPPNKVASLKVASTKGGGGYEVTFGVDRDAIKICSTGGWTETDVVVIWSDDPKANRLM